jgi:hypothetical protein
VTELFYYRHGDYRHKGHGSPCASHKGIWDGGALNSTASYSRHQAEVSAHLHGPPAFNFVRLVQKLKTRIARVMFHTGYQDSARLSACIINRTLSTLVKMTHKRERILCLRSRKALEDFYQKLKCVDRNSALYTSPNIFRAIKSRRIGWVGHVAHMRERRGVHRFLVRKPEGKRSLGRVRSISEDYISMDLQKVGYGYVLGRCGSV